MTSSTSYVVCHFKFRLCVYWDRLTAVIMESKEKIVDNLKIEDGLKMVKVLNALF